VLGTSGNGAAAEATALTTAPIDGSGEELRSLGATLLSLDRTTGLAIIECGQEPPQQLSVLPNEFVDGAPVARALRQVAAAMVAEPTTRTALGELLARRRPTVALPSAAADAAADGTLQAEGPMAPVCAGEDVVDAAVASVLALRRSYLCRLRSGPARHGQDVHRCRVHRRANNLYRRGRLRSTLSRGVL